MTRRYQAAIAVGAFVFLFSVIPGLPNRKLTWAHEFSNGLTRVRRVSRKPTSALHELVSAAAAGAVFGFLVWWAS